jgi:hypothetical protein
LSRQPRAQAAVSDVSQPVAPTHAAVEEVG